MADPKVRIDLTAKDDASKVIDQVADKVDELESLDPDVEITSNADKVANELKQLASVADQELTQAARAAEKLGQALGPELAGKADMGSIIADFQRMGLTLEEITLDADKLADALKQMDQVQTKALDSGLGKVKTQMTGVRDSADQSRSVLANMVGNSVQDLGALGGVAGTAGMALGQIGEYATEGGISLSNLAKVAGPMAALSAATLLVSSYMKGIAETKAFHKERVEGFTDALDDAVVSAEELQDILSGDAGQSILLRYAGQTEDVEDAVANTLGTFEEFKRVVDEGQGGLSRWLQTAIEAGEAAGMTEEEALDLARAIVEVGEGQGIGVASGELLNSKWKDMVLTGAALYQTVQDQGGAYDEAGRDAAFYGEKTDDAGTKSQRAADHGMKALERQTARITREFEILQGQLDMETAINTFQTNFMNAMIKSQEGTALTGEDILGLKQDILDVATYANLNPVQVKALMKAVEAYDVDGVLSMVQQHLNRNPVGIPTRFLPPSNAAGGVGRPPGTPVPTMVGPDGGAAAPAVTNVYQTIPRGWRGDALADAERAARRSGGLYRRSRR